MELTTSLLHALLVACDQSYNRNPIAGQALAPFGDSPTPGTADAPPNSMPPAWQDDLAGWTEDKRFDDPANGFGAVVYKKAASGGKFDYIVATQGTRGLNAQDWQGNLTYGWEKFTASNGGQKLINYLLGTGTDGILTTTNQIHFTGQSMGGALAQYVAYEYVDVRQNVDEDPTFSQANVSLTTFNGLGGVEALSHNYQTDIGGSDPARVFNPALLSGVATAHYYIANDFVSSLGGGHLNGSEYLINLYRPNPLDGASLAYYKPVDAHRIETGFYHGAQVGAIDQGGSGANYDIFANAYLREITQVQIAQAAKAGTLIGNLLNDGNTGPLEAKARLAAAAMIALADGPADDIRNLTQALLDHAHLSGMLTDSAYNHLYPRLDKALRAFAQSSAGQTAAMKALAVAGIVNALGGEGVSQSYADITSAMALLTPQMGGSAADLAITEMGNFNAPFFSAHDGQDRQETELAILDGLLLIAGDPALIPSLALTIVQTYFDDFVDLLKTSNDFQKDMLKFVAQKAIELDIDIGKATVQMAGWLWQQAQDAGNAVYESAAELQAYLDGQAQEIGNALSGVVKAAANGFDELIKKFSDPLFAWGQGVTRRVLDQFNGAFEASFRSGGGIFAGAGASASWGAAEDEIEEAQRIVQGTSQLIVLRPGAGPNPFDDENFDPDAAPVAAGVLRENGAQSFTLYLPYGAGEDGLKVKLQLAGAAAAAFDVYRNGIRIASGAGEFELSLEAGQRSASFTLAALRDIDADETLGLSAQLLDAQGSPTHQSHLELNLAFDATQEPDPVPGGLIVLQDDNPVDDPAGVSYGHHEATNITVIGTHNEDRIVGNAGDDVLQGANGNDYLAGESGQDKLIGGDGFDKLYGGWGDDRLYAAGEVDPVEAIAVAATDAQAPLAEFLEGGPGDDLMVGGVTNYLYGGGGRDFMIGGGGVDIAQGDTWDGGTETVHTSVSLHVDYNEAKHKHYFYISEVFGGATTLYSRFGHLDLDGEGDTIFTGAGNDTAMGELGDDIIFMGAGNDLAFGGEGSDTIHGEDGDDFIFGDFNWDDSAPGGEETPEEMVNYAGLDAQYHGADVLDGGAGNDVIYGNGGDDELDGGEGDDALYGDDGVTPGAWHGRDILYGGAGNDTLWGGGKDDALYGGAGDDELSGDNYWQEGQFQGNDYLDGGAGADKLWGNGGNDELYGGAGNDHLEGDYADLDGQYHGNDLLDGEEGDDELVGGGKDDILYGGAGNDKLSGDSGEGMSLDAQYHGRDELYGEDGDDLLIGGGKADRLFGGDGADRLEGDGEDVAAEDQGDDWLDGGAGTDQLIGGGGNDTLLGGADTDNLDGGAGDDLLIGGAGGDYLQGGEGNDTYVLELGDSPIDPANTEVIDDMQGNNTVRFGAGIGPDGLIVQQDASGQFLVLDYGVGDRLAIRGGFGGAISRFEFADGTVLTASQLIGRNFNDAVSIATADPDQVLTGGTQDDQISATGGGSTISGGRGNDTLTASGGNNTYLFELGDGSDHISDTSPKLDGQGNPLLNTLKFGAGIGAADISLGLGSLRINVGSDPNDAIHIENFNPDDALANPAIDRFEFADGTVLTFEQLLARGFDISGTGGDDTLSGTNVADRIDGGAGNDALRGGAGSDTYTWGRGSGQDTIDNADASAGKTDTLRIVGLTAAELKLVRNADNLVVTLRDGTDRVVIGNHFNGAPIDRIAFDDGTTWYVADMAAHLSNDLTNGADIYTGTAGADIIDALDGNDTVNALGGNDTVYGGGGNDTLDGGTGDDLLVGGTGTDTLRGGDGNDMLDGGDAVDNLYGGNGNDILIGGAGADNLNGEAGNDWLEAGTDGGTSTGGAGNDIYVFRAGEGSLTINNYDGGSVPAESDVLRVQGIAPAQLFVRRSGDDLLMTVSGSADSIRVLNHYREPESVYALNAIEFGDGTVWDTAVLRAKVLEPTESADVLRGYASNDIILGAGGNDTLYGENGDDTLEGGTGNDSLTGGDGSDTYYFSAGDGKDVIYNSDASAGRVDRLVFREGIAPENVRLSRNRIAYNGTDELILTLVDSRGAITGDEVRLSGYFTSYGGTSKVDRIEFANGTVWSIDAVKTALITGNDLDQSLMGYELDDVIDGLGGADLLTGDLGNDQLFGGSGDDIIYGETGNDWLEGGSGDDTIYGDTRWGGFTPTAGNDVLRGDAGKDKLYGDGGNDDLEGGAGRDELYGGAGDDTYRFGAGQGFDKLLDDGGGSPGGTDRLVIDALPGQVSMFRYGNAFGADDLYVVLGSGADQILVTDFFNTAKDNAIESIEFSNGTVWNAADIAARVIPAGVANAMTGTAGNDVFVVDHLGDTVTEAANQGTDTVRSSVWFQLPNNVENLELTGNLAIDGAGNSLDNLITGNDAPNKLTGGSGSDTLIGGGGDDTLDGEYGSDVMSGGAGDDYYFVGDTSSYSMMDTVIENAGEGFDTVYVRGLQNYVMPDHVENMLVDPQGVVWGSPGSRHVGNALDNTIEAVFSLLTSASQIVELDGGAGADLMIGRGETNIYVVDNVGDQIVESGIYANGSQLSVDTVKSSVSYTLGANLENLILTGTQALTGTGNELNNTLDGTQNSAANHLIGGAGDDTYVLGTGDTVFETAGEGTDTVVFAVGAVGTYAVSDYANIENAQLRDVLGNSSLVGNDAANSLTGNAGNNVLIGGAGNDILAGGSGDDRLEGGEGDDRLVAGNGWNVLDGGAGDDTLENSSGNTTYRFGAGYGHDLIKDYGGVDKVELMNVLPGDVVLTRSGDDLLISLPGGEDVLTVNQYFYAGGYRAIESIEFPNGNRWDAAMIAQRLSAGNGNVPTEDADALAGGAGDDMLVGLGGNDQISGGAGDDLLEGEAGNDVLAGDGGDDVLDGGIGNDTLYGGIGADTYVLRRDAGQDTIVLGATPDGAPELLRFADVTLADIRMFSRNGNDLLVDYAATDRATVQGYFADPAWANSFGIQFADGALWNGAQIALALGNFAPVLQAPIADQRIAVGRVWSYAVPAAAFTDPNPGDTLSYAAMLGDGLPLPAWLSFDATSRTFSGTPAVGDMGAIEVMVMAIDAVGMAASDRFALTVVAANQAPVLNQPISDVSVQENGSVSLILPEVTFVDPDADDALALTATLADGSPLPSWLTFNSASRSFSGAPGIGNLGSLGIRVTATDLLGDQVDDTFVLTVTAAPGQTFTGTSGNDTLTGMSGDDTLDGGAGSDTMRGGKGNDIYIVGSTGDKVFENAGEGSDEIRSSVTFTLSANVENLILTGTSAINGTGNDLDNVLIGNSAKNTLKGGLGNDTYFVSSTDVVTETANQGIDTVSSGGTWTLGSNLENLLLTGTTAINGTGNTLSNYLRGNTANNTLKGGTGIDLLEGGAGNDTLSDSTASDRGYFNGGAGTDTLTGGSGAEIFIGGTGNDTLGTGSGADVIVFNLGDGQDTVTSAAGQDNTISLGGGIRYEDITLAKSGNHLVVQIGSGERITLNNWYATTPVKSVLKLQVIAEAMADFDDNGADPLRDDKIETFDFAGVVNAFDAARAANPGLTSWAVTNALTQFHLSGSDTAALGGDLAYQYGRYGSLANVGLVGAQNVLGNAQFGVQAQTLQPLAGLQEGVVRLS